MTADATKRSSLSAQVLRVTLLIGSVTIAAAVVVSAVSVSRLTSQNMRSRDEGVLQAVNERIESRLRNTSVIIDQTSTHAFASGDMSPLSEIIALSYSSNRSRLDQLLVVDRDGRVRASAPQKLQTVRGLLPFVRARAGSDGFSIVWKRGGSWELWVTRTAIGRDGEPLIVMARLDTEFVRQATEEASEELGGGRLVMLDADRKVVVGDKQMASELERANWSIQGPSKGSVVTQAESGETLTGSFLDVGQLQGLSWRIVLVHPASAPLSQTLNAIGPPMLVLVIGGTVALVFAWILSMRVSRPLKDLERAALAAASGAYVRPITVHSEDEIGQVAKAFNAVALRLNALHDLSQLLASASRLDQVLDGILAAMGHLVGPGSAAIYFLEAGPTFVPVRTRGRELAHAGPVSALDSGWLNTALATGDTIRFSGSGEELRKELPGFSGGPVEALAAPLTAGREQLGVVVITRDAQKPLSEGEREMLRTFSAQASVAVHTSRLFAEETLSRKTAEVMRQVAEELVRPRSLESALAVVEHIVAELFGAERASVVLIDRAALGMPEAVDPQEESVVLGAAYGALGGARQDGATVVSSGTDRSVDTLLVAWECQQLLVVPIGLDTNHGAVMVVGFSENRPEEALSVSEALADEVALALDNAYFYQRAVTRAANLETIFRISQAVGSSLQINVVLNRVLDVVQKILSADAVGLMSYENRSRALKASMGRGELPARFMSMELEPGEDVPGQVFSRGEPVALRDLHAGMGGLAGMAAEVGLRSMLAVPLLARGRSIGVLIVFSMQSGAFLDEDVNVLQTFASQAALAIDTARLYSREHEVATVLQQSILPDELPDFPEIRAGSVYEPAGRETEIGGDYYDVFRGDGSIWFAIGDVCGKGVYAATKTSMIKYVVRALVVAGYSPARVMAEVNDMIAEGDDPSDIVTLWLGRYDPASGCLTWSDGGHPPGLLRRSDGSIEPLEVTGALLGAMKGAPYEEGSTTVESGETILLYTDGVTEARRGNIFFGEDRVREVLAKHVGAQETARDLLGAVRTFVQGELRDDVAVLVVEPRADARREGNA